MAQSVPSVQVGMQAHADRYIPDSLRTTADQQLRARVVVLFARVGVPVALFFFVAYGLEREWRISLINLITFPVVLLVPLQLRRFNSHGPPGHLPVWKL